MYLPCLYSSRALSILACNSGVMVRYLGNSVTDDLSANAKSSITLAKLLKRKALHRIEELQPHAETDLSKEDLDSVVKNNQKI